MLEHDSSESIRRWAKELRNKYDRIRTPKSERKQAIKKRHDEISPLLSPQNIVDLDEPGFRELFKNLWASGMWGNKDYRANTILEENGIEKIRISLNGLLYGAEPLETRFDNFNVKYFGMATITEIMVTMSPDRYALLNSKTRKFLQKLDTDQIPRSAFKSAKMLGSDYVKCNEIMMEIAGILSEEYENKDIDLDLFVALGSATNR